MNESGNSESLLVASNKASSVGKISKSSSFSGLKDQKDEVMRRLTQEPSLLTNKVSMQFGGDVTTSGNVLGQSADARNPRLTPSTSSKQGQIQAEKSQSQVEQTFVASSLPSQRRNCYERLSDWITRKLTVTSKELRSTKDLGIVKKRRMKIYSITNLIAFLLQLTVFTFIQFGTDEQIIKIWHWQSI